MELGHPAKTDSDDMWASSSKSCSIEFLIETNKDSNGIVASSSKACIIEFLKEINKDCNGM
jgi:hypothetical protein